MGKAFLAAYSRAADQDLPPPRRLRHGRHGGADSRSKNDPAANEAAFAKVRADKEREATRRPRRHLGRAPRSRAGREGGVRPADAGARTSSSKLRDDVACHARATCSQVHEGKRTEAGLRENIRVGVQYIEAWLRGRGAVPLYNLMEDAATAEISPRADLAVAPPSRPSSTTAAR